MAAAELVALFEMAKRHVTLVDFSKGGSPGFDLYVVRGKPHHAAAFAVLAAAGLAHPVDWHGLACYRLDEEAKAALGG